MTSPMTKRFQAAKKPPFWLLHALGWASYIAIFTFDNVYLLGKYDFSDNNIFQPLLFIGIVAFVLTVPLRYIYRRCWHLNASSLIATVVLCSLVVAIVWTPVKNLILWYFTENDDVMQWLRGQGEQPFRWQTLFVTLSYSLFIVLVWSSLYFGINFYYRLLDEKQRHLDAARLSHSTHLKMLRYQINPHLLFNTLHAVSTLVLKGDKDRANGMLTRLSSFLRFSLDNDPESRITLFEELKILMLYLDIEKIRFGDRLTVCFRVSPEAETKLVPSLLLQPLVENSIKYAISAMTEAGEIHIHAMVKNNLLHLQVADNGPGVDSNTLKRLLCEPTQSEGTGVGLRNIRERLAVLYPRQHTFEVDANTPQGLRVSISIPAEESE